MSATMIVLGTPAADGSEALQEYVAGAGPLMKEAGAAAASRYKFEESLVGNDHPAMVATVDFPNADAIRSFINHPKYQELIPLREAAFSDIKILICHSA